jgi:ABC-type polysaccharide/polyol phosphate transport system ATPase subunit
MEELCSSGTTLLLVSHNPEDVLGMCQRAIWLDRGTIAFDGKADIALERYLKSS